MGSVNFDKLVKQVMKELDTVSASKPVKSKKQSSYEAASPPEPEKDDEVSRSAVLTGKKYFEIFEDTLPIINADEILIKIEGCGISHQDIELYENADPALLPLIPGKSGTGIVIKRGKESIHIRTGDRVVIPAAFSHFERNLHNGWLADYIVVKNSPIFSVNSLSLELRLLTEPAATAIHAVNISKDFIRFGTDIAVVGCTTIGLMVIAILSAKGIKNITAVDKDEIRLSAAKKAGASKTIICSDSFEEFNDRQDFIFQCSNSYKGHFAALNMAKKGFCEMGLSQEHKGKEITISSHLIYINELTVLGSYSYNLSDYKEAVAFLQLPDSVRLESFITGRFTLDKIDSAFEWAMTPDDIQTIVVTNS